MEILPTTEEEGRRRQVNLSLRRTFGGKLRHHLKETFLPDDPFRRLGGLPPSKRALAISRYLIPILEWGPKYDLSAFRRDFVAGITTATLAVPQGISCARLAHLPPVIGLYSSFVPPLVYAVLGSSNHLAVGNVAAGSLLLASIIEAEVSYVDDLTTYVHVVFTACFFTGVLQLLLGVFRLGIVVDFLGRSTITGFMGGTACLVILQQLKGMFGLERFTSKTGLIPVMRSLFSQAHEWKWESFVMGVFFMFFLLSTELMVGKLQKGLNKISISNLQLHSKYLGVAMRVGIISGFVAIAQMKRWMGTRR